MDPICCKSPMCSIVFEDVTNSLVVFEDGSPTFSLVSFPIVQLFLKKPFPVVQLFLRKSFPCFCCFSAVFEHVMLEIYS